MPFLENVTGGRGIPRERLAAVAEHYCISWASRRSTDQSRADHRAGSRDRSARVLRQPQLGTYVEDTVAAMRDNGSPVQPCSPLRRGAATPAAPVRRGIARARTAAGQGAPELVKLRQYFDHPLFVEMFTEAIGAAAQTLPDELRNGHGWCSPRTPFPSRPDRVAAQTCTAARWPMRRAWSPLRQAMKLRPGVAVTFGPPQVPWLEPDIGDHLTTLTEAARRP